MSQFFTSGCPIIGVSASASVLPMNIQDCIPLGWTVGSPTHFSGYLLRTFMSESLCKGLQVSLCKGLKDGGGRARFDPEKKKKRFLPRGPVGA